MLNHSPTSMGSTRGPRVLPRCFSGNLPWASVIPTLGISLSQDITQLKLPAIVQCPFCQGRLIVYPDISHIDNVWLHCSGCNFCGDLIDLASRVFNQPDTMTVLKKLTSLNVNIDQRYLGMKYIRVYDKRYKATRQTNNKYWEKVSKYPFQNNEDMLRLHDQLGIQVTDVDRWRVQLGNSIGHITGEDEETQRIIRKNKTESIVNFGKKTKAMIVLPFHDVPGRILGYYYGTAYCRYPKDWQYRTVNNYMHDESAIIEAGIAFFEAAHSFSKEFDKTAFVIQNPAQAVALHARWFKDHNTPLPLAVSYDGSYGLSQMAFTSMPKRNWVFWSDTPNKAIFRQAGLVDGRVVIGSIEPKDITRPEIWLHGIEKKALLWYDVLQQQMARLSDAELEQILLHLELTDEQWRLFLYACTRPNKKRIKFLTQREYHQEKIHISTRTGHLITIVEQKDGWYVNGKIITDARLRIKILFLKENEVWIYGHILFRGKQYPFECREAVFSPIRPTVVANAVSNLITRVLAENGAGVPVFDPYWLDRLYQLAKLFRRPRLFTGKSFGIIKGGSDVLTVDHHLPK